MRRILFFAFLLLLNFSISAVTIYNNTADRIVVGMVNRKGRLTDSMIIESKKNIYLDMGTHTIVVIEDDISKNNKDRYYTQSEVHSYRDSVVTITRTGNTYKFSVK